MFSIISKAKNQKNQVNESYEKIAPFRPGATDVEAGREVRTSRGDISYSPAIFSQLRKLWGIGETEYEDELSRVTPLGEGAGKSKMLFWKSKRSRYFLKTMPAGEIATLMGKILKSYFVHMKKHKNSMLPRFLGMYKENGINFLVQTNVMHGLKNPYVYDLKGSLRHRKLKDFKRGKVGKDANFGDSTISSAKNEEIIKALESDSNWLKRSNLMDYSLLVVMDDGTGKACSSSLLPAVASFRGSFKGPPPSSSKKVCVHVGVIDILQKFGIKKMAERYFKTKRQNKIEDSEVSAIQSSPYKVRFMAMAKDIFDRPGKRKSPRKKKSPRKRKSPRKKKSRV